MTLNEIIKTNPIKNKLIQSNKITYSTLIDKNLKNSNSINIKILLIKKYKDNITKKTIKLIIK